MDAVKLLNDRGYYVFLITNQAGVAHGHYEEEAIHTLHGWMREELRRNGAHLDDVRYCPYHPEGAVEKYRRASDWRKPEAGMLRDLSGDMRICPLDDMRKGPPFDVEG